MTAGLSCLYCDHLAVKTSHTCTAQECKCASNQYATSEFTATPSAAMCSPLSRLSSLGSVRMEYRKVCSVWIGFGSSLRSVRMGFEGSVEKSKMGFGGRLCSECHGT